MIIGKFIGVILVILSVVTILGLIIGLFTIGSLDFIHEDWLFQNSVFYNQSGLPIWIISILTLILVAIPFFFLFALGLRILSNNTKSIGKITKLTLLGIWLVALLTMIFFGTRQFMRSAYDGTVTNNKEIMFNSMDTLEIKMVDDKNISKQSSLKRHWKSEIIYDNDKGAKIYSNDIRLNILPSDDDLMYAKTSKRSQGMSRKNARDNADLITYDYELSGDELRLDGFFLADINNKFTEQRVYVDLYLPEGQVIYLDHSTKTFLYDVDNTQNIYDNDMAKHYFIMTKEGLSCLDCKEHEMNVNHDAESFNLKINDKGVHIEIQDVENEKAQVKIDKNGVEVKTSKDSL
jgi:hypothetical protein